MKREATVIGLVATLCACSGGECLGGGPTTTTDLTLSAPLSALALISLTPASPCFLLCDAIDEGYAGEVVAAEAGTCTCTFDDPTEPVTLLPDGGYAWTDGGAAFLCTAPSQLAPNGAAPMGSGVQFGFSGYDGGNCQSAVLAWAVPMWAADLGPTDGGPGSRVPPEAPNAPTCAFPTDPDAGPSVVCTCPGSTHCGSLL